MPAATVTPPKPRPEPKAESEASAMAEVFLAPRVVDEQAFRSMSTRLRELVGQADQAQATLGGVSDRGAELLSSLEALIHTQTKRAVEIRKTLEDVEAKIRRLDLEREKASKEAERVSGFEQRASAQLAAITEASAGVVERAQEAQRVLEEAIEHATARAATIESELVTVAAPRLEGLEAQLERLEVLIAKAEEREASLLPVLDRSSSASETVRETADQLEGLQQQSKQLLSAMRATILECADARDAADKRLERLGSLGSNAKTVLDALSRQVKRAEERAAKITPAEMDLDPIVRAVAERVMRAMESRFATALERKAAPRAEKSARDHAVDEKLKEIQASLEMLSGVTLRLAEQPAAAPLRMIPPAPETVPPAPRGERRAAVRLRRSVSVPVGGSGEFGGPGEAVTVWSWTEGQG